MDKSKSQECQINYPGDHLFSLLSCPIYGFFCGRSGDEQMIAGRTPSKWNIVRFNSSGDLIQADEMENKGEKSPPIPGFVNGLVQVKKFALPNIFMAISDLPEHLERFVKSPDEYLGELYPEEDLEYGWETENRALKEWFSNNQFAFQFHEVFWMNADGTVNSF